MSDEERVSDQADEAATETLDDASDLASRAFSQERETLGGTDPGTAYQYNPDNEGAANDATAEEDIGFNSDVSDEEVGAMQAAQMNAGDEGTGSIGGMSSELNKSGQAAGETPSSMGSPDEGGYSGENAAGATSGVEEGAEALEEGAEVATEGGEVASDAAAGTAAAPGVGTAVGAATGLIRNEKSRNAIIAVIGAIFGAVVFFLLMVTTLVSMLFQSSGKNGNQVVERALQEYEAYVAAGTIGGEKYTDRLGFSGPTPWCAAFVSYICDECGIGTDIVPQSAAVAVYYDYYREQGNFHYVNDEPDYIPSPGDFIIWQGPSGLATNHPYIESHIGIVEYYDAETNQVHTIEGNSSNSIMRNSYAKNACSGYAHPNYPASIGGGGMISIPETYQGIPVGRGFTVTEYDVFYGRWSNGTTQKYISEIWAQKGKVFTDGIATIDGKLLIACTSKYGSVGDHIQFYLDDGTVLDCIMADEKSSGDSTYTEWGHRYGGGTGINVVEFEVQSSYFRQYGNPGSSSWRSEWQGKRVCGATNMGRAFE